MPDALPDPLPPDPFPLLERWIKEAGERTRNPTAMTLATVAPDGRPTARMVICRGIDAQNGWLVFYTDRESDKGTALGAHPRAALVFHWEALERQVRVEGPVTRVPESDSDAYWSSRPQDAQVAASISHQSRELADRSDLVRRYETLLRESEGRPLPRPERWGGFRVWADRVELWAGQPARLHDRAHWLRELSPAGGGYRGGAWRATRLDP